jgi:beta-lactamase regulating signal transducer with metallopeptidase domain
LKRKYRLRRLPQVVLTGQIQNALTVGIFHPQILLQRHLVHELSRGQLRDVLDHEMAHVIRRDCLVMFLEQVARACHWCNPCLQWLCNELARSREQLCDNTVLTQRPPIAYGETLLRVAELSLSGGTYRQVLAMLARWSDLRWRMQAILDPRQQRSATVGIPSAATMCVGLLFCGWLMGGVTFTTESFDRFHPTMYPQRSHFHANLVAATR